MNFCSHCGSKELQFSIPEGDNRPRFWCRNCQAIHYQNPRMIVGCLVAHEEKVLLCKRGIEPCYGLWNLPAGFLENGEAAEMGALRETFEETLARVEIQQLHCVYNLPHVNQVYLHFLATFEALSFSTTTPESLEVALFAENEIPWDSIAFSSTEFALKKYFEFREQPQPSPVHFGTYEKPTSA